MNLGMEKNIQGNYYLIIIYLLIENILERKSISLYENNAGFNVVL
jgi:hypothetical protein